MNPLNSRLSRVLGTAGLVLAVTLAPGTATASPVGHEGVVRQDPADTTPHVLDDEQEPNAAVLALAESGGQIVAGGAFRTVANADRSRTYARHHLMAFDAGTGEVSTTFAPRLDGQVWTVAASGSWLYVGGEFTTVDGVHRPGLARIHAVTGELDPAFAPGISGGRVSQVAVVHGRLVVGGRFQGALRALDLRTGADTGDLDLDIEGKVTDWDSSPEVYRFSVDPAGERIVAIGNFSRVDGAPRKRAFMVDLAGGVGRLNPWRYAPLDRLCADPMRAKYLRDVDFSPDGSYFVIVSSGDVPAEKAHIGTSVCMAAARFETDIAHPARPTWVNYTGGNTLHSVAVTGAAVYVQGHQQWLDNPHARKAAGPGAVYRPGIGAIDPETGKALPWNPTKSRDVGGKDFLVTPDGLWVASDGQRFNGEDHSGIAFCPL